MAKEQQLSKRQEELAKWVMDLAKYILTGIVISPMFGSIENKWLTVVAGLLIASALMYAGITILGKQTKQTTKKRK